MPIFQDGSQGFLVARVLPQDTPLSPMPSFTDNTVAVVDRAHTDLDAANSMALLYPHPKWLSRESWALIFILFNQISCLWECHIYALS